MAEILTPCICDNSVGDINSSVTFAIIAYLSFFEKSLAVLFRELIRDKAPGSPVTLALLEIFFRCQDYDFHYLPSHGPTTGFPPVVYIVYTYI